VVYATLVVITVFIPVLLIDSLEGRFVGPLAQAFIYSVLASLVVALTLTPALCALLLVRRTPAEDAGWIRAFKRWQVQVLVSLHRHWKSTLLVMTLLLGGSLALLPWLGGRFLPDFRESHLVVQMSANLPGVSLGDMNALGEKVSAALLAEPYVASVSFQVGRAELSEDTWGPHRSEFHVELKPGSSVDPEQAQQNIRRLVSAVPGVQTEVVSFLGDRISESLSGESGQVAVKLFGNDLDALDETADKVVAALSGQPHVIDLQFRRQDGTPMLDIEPRSGALLRYGVKSSDLLDAVGSAYEGEELGEVHDGLRTVRAVTQIADDRRRRPEALGQLPVSTPFGVVPLMKLAHVSLREGRYSIDHEGAARRVVVTFNVEGDSVETVAMAAQKRIASQVKLPAGVSLLFAGEGEAEHKTRTQLMLYAGLALVLVVVLLHAAFRWNRNAGLVMLNLPFSLVGGVLAIAATGLDLSLGVVVGLVTVFGISARNAILQLSHYEHMVFVEGHVLNLDTVCKGANERLVPILMTAVVTALGLVPLAVGLHRPGQEIEGPMAVAVLGGLASSTVLNLLVLPLMAVRWIKPESAE
jgi:Cu/Ag efflux pump CusA